MRLHTIILCLLVTGIMQILLSQNLISPVVTVDFSGNSNISNKQLQELVKSRFENKVNENLLNEDCQRIRNYYLEAGYLAVNCTFVVNRDRYPQTIAIEFRITEGRLFTFGDITFTGNQKTENGLLRQLMQFKKGMPFSKQSILNTRSRLMRTGLFSDVYIRRGSLDESTNEISVTIEVTEKSRYYNEFGTGYDSEDSWQNFIIWGNRYIDGYGKKLTFTGLHAIDYDADFYFKKGEVILDYQDHVFIKSQITQNLRLFYTNDKPKAVNFGLEKFGMTFGLNYELSKISMFYTQLTFDKVNLFSVDAKEDIRSFQEKITDEESSGITIGYDRDKRDDFVDPTRGTEVDIQLYFKPGLVGDVQPYTQISTRFNLYRLLFQRIVFANQSTLRGQLLENPSDYLPSYLRLYLGGSSSLRGFSQSSLGPQLPDGTSQGGHFLFLNNFELRYYLSYSFNFVVLFDTGNLWLESPMIKLATLKNSTGAGIRYRSRFGLFRLDFAIPLNSKVPGRFHIGFGQAF